MLLIIFCFDMVLAFLFVMLEILTTMGLVPEDTPTSETHRRLVSRIVVIFLLLNAGAIYSGMRK